MKRRLAVENQISGEDLAACMKVLRSIAIGDKTIELSEDDQRTLARASRRIRKQRQRDQAEDLPTSREPRNRGEALGHRCYGCFAKRSERGENDWFCTLCQVQNQQQRDRVVDLRDHVAIVTGGRMKIGHAVALRLLRLGATVHITSRFVDRAKARFEIAPDCCDWLTRLHYHQCDFRNFYEVADLLVQFEQQLEVLDILIHNAAQTVRDSNVNQSARLHVSTEPARRLADDAGLTTNAVTKLTKDLVACVDENESNSWTMTIEDVHPVELMETYVVNAYVPFLLNQRLRAKLRRSPRAFKHVVHVTGADGCFARQKTTRHPHVNMSKAALNMMTRTIAEDYRVDNVCVNSVDTGWVTHEGSRMRRQVMYEQGFRPPLDFDGAAARIVAPIFDAIEGQPSFGQIFRNFQPSQW